MHSQSYPVTAKVSLPQPHVTYEETKTPAVMRCNGWLPFTLVGAAAITLILCVNFFGGKVLFLEVMNRTSGLIPIIKQGTLKVYPFLNGSENGIDSSYVTILPPKNASENAKTLDDLLKSYPERHGRRYRNCWLENPTPEHPCYFDSSWIKEVCTLDNSYGYKVEDGLYNPCFILKLENTGDWVPNFFRNVPDSISDHYDPGFIPVHCFVKKRTVESLFPKDITVYPPKGFSHLFFPISKFNSEKYLSPLVAVKVNGIRRQENVTVECSIYTPNSYTLWNNGRVVVKFEAA